MITEKDYNSISEDVYQVDSGKTLDIIKLGDTVANGKFQVLTVEDNTTNGMQAMAVAPVINCDRRYKMKKRRIFISLVVAITILILGGCGMASQKETLTKEQQDNVVKRISRNYKIKKVEFVNLERNNSTGYYSLVFKVNDKKTTNIVQFKNAEEFDSSEGIIALDPIEEFTDIKKSIEFDSSKRVDISDITIIYLKG